MILRRIAEAFRRQDWFTVAFGVFIGVQQLFFRSHDERRRAAGRLT